MGKKHDNNSPNTPEEKVLIKSNILKIMKKDFVGIVTTSEISNSLNISWNTAEKYMLELAIDRKVQRVKKKGVNIWVLKKPGEVVVHG